MSDSINEVSKLLEQLPGVGSRSARRMILHLLKNRETLLLPLSESLKDLNNKVKQCYICYNISTDSPCNICTNPKRDDKTICIVDDIPSLWALERISGYTGKYHVLGGLLSALSGVGPAQLRIAKLKQRIVEEGTSEIIMALPATTEGQITMYYISDAIADLNLKITSLGQGVPMGGELDYLDEGTLSIALKSRKNINVDKKD